MIGTMFALKPQGGGAGRVNFSYIKHLCGREHRVLAQYLKMEIVNVYLNHLPIRTYFGSVFSGYWG
jgi:hypothetical protein